MIVLVLLQLAALKLFYVEAVRVDKENLSQSWTKEAKDRMRVQVLEMFDHAYNSYMTHAYPADELMPLSCKGRYRGSEADRGDIDEALGNFSLTLIDSLDTLAVLGRVEEFEKAVMLVIGTVSFNTDVVVSVFETNIRVLGGLLGAHAVAVSLRESGKSMVWYRNELLLKAIDIGERLLVAFNTSTGIPFPKVNLKFGVYNPRSRVGHEQDTCTACAGTMIMEFAALSRMSGNPIYEEKAHRAMDALWSYRSRHSDLVGTVINIHNGDWVRRDSGVGAGIDSYYEYCLKAYVLLGDESYLAKFNKHYSAINKYIRQGSMMLDVLMHQPDKPVRTFMDALQAFWPGLQVLLGDLKPAIETHEMLYEVAKRHKFLPEAFTSNLDVYWAQHPLRPELAESTYFLYEATKDPYYLDAGKHIIEAMQNYARVPCGFAAVKDVRTLSHEDKMDSFVLAETFKYLYLLFSEEQQRLINVHDYLFTTEAHLLPLTLSNLNSSGHAVTDKPARNLSLAAHPEDSFMSSCPNKLSYQDMAKHTEEIRKKARVANQGTCPTTEQKILETYLNSNPTREAKLRAEHFQVGNKDHLKMAKDMGITITLTQDGRVQLMHQAALAVTTEDAQDGIRFMQDMIQLAKTRGEHQGDVKPRVVQLMTKGYKDVVFSAGAAQFGIDLESHNVGITSELVEAVPQRACSGIDNMEDIKDRIVLIERGDCMFIDKVRQAQTLGALGVIIIDHNEGTSSETQPTFAMSGDNHSVDVTIPSVFLFRKEGILLQKYLRDANAMNSSLVVRIAARAERRDTGDVSANNSGVTTGDSSAHTEANYKVQAGRDSGWTSGGQTGNDGEDLGSPALSKGGSSLEKTRKDEQATDQPLGNDDGKRHICCNNVESSRSTEEQVSGDAVEAHLRAINAQAERTLNNLQSTADSAFELTEETIAAVLGLEDTVKTIPSENDNSNFLKGSACSKSSRTFQPIDATVSEVKSDAVPSEDPQKRDDSVHSRNGFIRIDEEYDKANAAMIKDLQDRFNSKQEDGTGSDSKEAKSSQPSEKPGP